MRKHKVALNKSGITSAGITTTLAVVDASALDCATVAQFHLFTNWNRYNGKIDASYVIRRSHTTTTIYVGVHTVCLLSMWECTLYVYSLCGSAHCMFTIYVGVHTVCLQSMWECILYVYSLCGSAYCMSTIYVRVHTVCLLSMWECILYVYYLCGSAYCLSTIYVGVHTVCLLSMWECILYV